MRGGGKKASYFATKPAPADPSVLPVFDRVVGMGFRPDGSVVVVDQKRIVVVDAQGMRVIAMGTSGHTLDFESQKPVFNATPKERPLREHRA